MDRAALTHLLARVRTGEVTVEGALETLRDFPFADLVFAKPDTHRALRTGQPEVIFGEGKTSAEIAAIAERLAAQGQNVLVTRLGSAQADELRRVDPTFAYHAEARIGVWRVAEVPPTGKGTILVVTAGTSDRAVAEEAAWTAELSGNVVERLYDVGVAGIHRLLAARARLVAAQVLIVVAGMEGALPSVVGGLVDKPVIAVPTSVGYGASLGGLAALLAMLNSCAAGVTVVNIDNGFGAAVAASRINHL
jgi:pyridinium-3,5-biscarboxylic acid mononucleotide synthase